MLKLYKHISCLTCFLLSLLAQGQDLPTLGTAPEIQRGSLPDGIQYYLVTQPEQKGHADFALVQRGRRDAAQARGMLRALPHFGDRAPYRFLADHGIGYHGRAVSGKTGYELESEQCNVAGTAHQSHFINFFLAIHPCSGYRGRRVMA